MIENEPVELTIVAPAFNEGESIQEFCSQIQRTLAYLDLCYELIVVDDGSTDDTLYFLEKEALRNPHLKVISLIKNSGQSKAIEIGLRNAKGEFCITMDTDLQHPTNLIFEMLKKGKDVGIVTAIQEARNEARWKSIASKRFYQILGVISGYGIRPNSGDFRLIRRDALELILSLKEPKIIRFLIPKYGMNEAVLSYNANPRFAGKSKYDLRRMMIFGSKSIIATTTRPLGYALSMAFAFSLFAIFDLIYIVFETLSGNTVPGWASTLGLLSIGISSILFCLGIIGVYLKFLIEAIMEPDSNLMIRTKIGFSETNLET